jgi:hypothetical protein
VGQYVLTASATTSGSFTLLQQFGGLNTKVDFGGDVREKNG